MQLSSQTLCFALWKRCRCGHPVAERFCGALHSVVVDPVAVGNQAADVDTSWAVVLFYCLHCKYMVGDFSLVKLHDEMTWAVEKERAGHNKDDVLTSFLGRFEMCLGQFLLYFLGHYLVLAHFVERWSCVLWRCEQKYVFTTKNTKMLWWCKVRPSICSFPDCYQYFCNLNGGFDAIYFCRCIKPVRFMVNKNMLLHVECSWLERVFYFDLCGIIYEVLWYWGLAGNEWGS